MSYVPYPNCKPRACRVKGGHSIHTLPQRYKVTTEPKLPLLYFRSIPYCYSRPSKNFIYRYVAISLYYVLLHAPFSTLILASSYITRSTCSLVFYFTWSTAALASVCNPERTRPLVTPVATTASRVWHHLYPWQIGCDSITLTQPPGHTKVMIYSRQPTDAPWPGIAAFSIKRCQNDVEIIHIQRY
jgi:hypothetical protein